MSRDHRKLRVFACADALVMEVYRVTASFPAEERYGLQAQLRRAVVSTATNIVEGSARRTTREYVDFLNIANGSTAEVAYLLDVATRLGLIQKPRCFPLADRCEELTKGLQRLIAVLEGQP